MKKLWAGRFQHRTSQSVEIFTESVSFDKRLWKHDIQGSIAHAQMLARQGIIPMSDSRAIIRGLNEIAGEILAGTFRFSSGLEDIHMNIEASLIKKIGDAAKRLHTARSRNDQISLDLRLYLREETHAILELIASLQRTLLSLSERHMDTMMPGYTHLQRAQPVLLAHHLIAYIEMLQRDKARLEDSLKRINVLPLGACALAGTTIPIDRSYVAKLLGFKTVSGNSIDSVSDRDFALEFLSCSAMCMMHLSRFAEELILWSTDEFRFIEISDRFTTGSSIMPQKKNPDVAELLRGKTGRMYGNMIALFTVMKGLPLAYNRDMQEDKLPVFDAVDTIKSCLSILNSMLPEVKFHSDRMLSAVCEGFSTATDIAEYLVKKGVPFREAHEITGKIVRHCISRKKDFSQLSLKEMRSFSSLFLRDIFTFLDPLQSINAHSSYGGTSLSEVKRQIRHYKKILL